MACNRCGQTHPDGEVCMQALEDRYGTLDDPSGTLGEILERDGDE